MFQEIGDYDGFEYRGKINNYPSGSGSCGKQREAVGGSRQGKNNANLLLSVLREVCDGIQAQEGQPQ